jgi:hypothetical protein
MWFLVNDPSNQISLLTFYSVYLIIPVTFYRVKYLGASARDRTTELGPMGDQTALVYPIARTLPWSADELSVRVRL